MTFNTNTIAQKLKSSEIDLETLHDNYHPMLELVKELLGVVPNCDKLLEIWSTGFRTYNLIVPNFLNLPFSLLTTVVEFAGDRDLESSADIERTDTNFSVLPMFSQQTIAALLLAKAASSSPAKINPHILTRIDRCLSPASIIELMVWLSIQQLLHRIGCFYQLSEI